MSTPIYVEVSTNDLNEMVAGDGGTLLDITLYDMQGKVVDLSTASSAWIRMKMPSSAFLLKQMQIAIPETQGRVTYHFSPQDTIGQDGICQYEVFTKDIGGNVINTQIKPGLFRVRAPLS